MERGLNLSPISEVISDFKSGRMVILVDDKDRENEGDLVVATELAQVEHIAFMMREGRGLICVSVDVQVSERLQLLPQVETNNSKFSTPFAVSLDHRDVALSGVTAKSRLYTMQRLVDPSSVSEDFVTPGHVFPLVANPSGVLGRRGQTEGSYDLARLCGLVPSGIICEILNPDGTMMRGSDLAKFAERHKLKITSIEEIKRYRVEEEIIVRKVAEAEYETEYGVFNVHVFSNDVDGKEHLVLVNGSPDNSGKEPIVRIHSECLTGDVFESMRCDCGYQLNASLRIIAERGCGALLYLRQEGRGIGLTNKVKAYHLQDRGRDTVEANVELGFKPDERDFTVAAKILSVLGLTEIELLTNNPNKIKILEKNGITVLKRHPLIIPDDTHCREYLRTKKLKLGHFL
ncbi:MAG: GTP cyclohydrolase II [Candidatus Dadabacteria bacterium]|nr:MAG: GTP cyclohydrolase II [Candidatus Dadabacteria bacterium]